jgi:hypothetical protein
MGSLESGANANAPAPVAPGAHESRRDWRSWAILLLAGLVAGPVAWGAGELAHGFFRPRTYRVEIMGMVSMQPSRESQKSADIANSTVASAILGAVTALMMGLAGGLAVRNPGRGLMVGLVAQAAGAMAGAAAAYALMPIFYWQLVPDSNDLLTPILIHGGVWTAIGVVGGMAFVAGRDSWRQFPVAAVFACVGAFLASILFHVTTGILFPHSSSAEPVGRSALVRLLATSLVTVLVAIGVAKGTLRRLPRAGQTGTV